MARRQRVPEGRVLLRNQDEHRLLVSASVARDAARQIELVDKRRYAGQPHTKIALDRLSASLRSVADQLDSLVGMSGDTREALR